MLRTASKCQHDTSNFNFHQLRKSVHSSKAVVDFGYHDAECTGCMLPGYNIVDVSDTFICRNSLYFHLKIFYVNIVQVNQF